MLHPFQATSKIILLKFNNLCQSCRLFFCYEYGRLLKKGKLLLIIQDLLSGFVVFSSPVFSQSTKDLSNAVEATLGLRIQPINRGQKGIFCSKSQKKWFWKLDWLGSPPALMHCKLKWNGWEKKSTEEETWLKSIILQLLQYFCKNGFIDIQMDYYCLPTSENIKL